MHYFVRMWALLVLSTIPFRSVSALDETDQLAIQEAINNYTVAWNQNGGKGFGDYFTQDADFVNIFGMYFSGKIAIEDRHVKLLQTFFQGSTLDILNTQLREVQPGLVIALVRWRLTGYRDPRFGMNSISEIREGIYTQVFIQSNEKWEITASQTTLIPKP